MTTEPATQYYYHGRFRVVGGVLPNAVTAYRTHGDPKNPCIVFPTCYGSKLDSQAYMMGPDKASEWNQFIEEVLNPDKYYIATIALFCNGECSSLSNTPLPYNGPYFPAISYEDNARAQYAALTKKLGIEHIYCVVGFSMGGQMVEYLDNFLEGPKAAMKASKDFEDDHYKSVPEYGIRAFGRVYCPWAYGQTWFRDNGYLYDGLDMLALLNTWQTADVSKVRDDRNLENRLGAIKAKGLIMPCKTDLYFTPEDSEIEVSYLKDTANLVVIDSVWGHVDNPGNSQLAEGHVRKTSSFIKPKLKRF
ncbi:homoserine acetyltransferase [Neolentinus lepideus HHB14362 ss-1]|uniref:Homoserine acetyltransferase n=1 Tax=Neolentinus lepideus HHB14362 ss-1 TaxID=1314782 RepID=A0A165V185_9AGAM|nr:homoserine acetyltransferase [Neolentinus lepideus HHB14362 ss-1]